MHAFNPSDEQLIRRIAHSDAEALAALYDRYSRLVFSLVRNMVGNPESAEEITLDVFTRIWERAVSYDVRKATVKRWIVTICRNRAIDVLRRRKRRLEGHSPKWTDVPLDMLADSRRGAEPTELAILQRQVTAAVAKLPGEQREVLALAYFQGYSHRQIAGELDLPLGTVKTRIRLAMDKLRHIFDSHKKPR